MPTLAGSNSHTSLPKSQAAPPARVSFQSHTGQQVQATIVGGRIQTVQAHGLTINHGVSGRRTVVTEQNGHRLVSTGAHQGYLERPYVNRNGRAYVQRTYVANNATYTHVYRQQTYRGVTYYGYVPGYYYHPAFYGWAASSWPAPVYYNWGWTGNPWYSYYGSYFAPSPAYPSASVWLTDYMLADNLRAAYEDQADTNATQSQIYAGTVQNTQNGNTPVLSPEVKQEIAEAVSQKLAADQALSSAPRLANGNATAPPAALDPTVQLFIVASSLDVIADGTECSLTAGDVLTRASDSPDGDNNVMVRVKASKKADCLPGKHVAVPVQALQEMYNRFEEGMDDGLKVLASSQGKNGLPTPPDTSTTSGEVPEPTPDANIGSALQKQQQDATQMEQEVAHHQPSLTQGQ